jgi:hypothetical protein
MRTAAILCLSLFLAAAQAADVYRYSDPRTGVEFSDTPRPGAEKIVIPEARRVPRAAAPRPPPDAPPPSDVPTGVAVAYSEVKIVDPADQDTVRDNAGNLLVRVTTSPALQTKYGHRLQLLLDGSAAQTGTSTSFSLSGIDRGTHVLEARVIGVDGKPLAASSSVTFFLHRASKRFKKPTPPPTPRP